MAERLWVCHKCELIGSGMEAARHADATDHAIEPLPDEVSAAVRMEQGAQQAHPTAADWIAFASFTGKRVLDREERHGC